MPSSLSSSFPSVVPRHCLSVPVLYELVRSEEEQYRVWLRAEMNLIADPLIDSIFHGLIMSSSSSAVPQSRLTVSELCQQLEGEKVQVSSVLRGEMDRVVNTLFERLTNKLRMTNSDLDRSKDVGDRAQVDNLLDQVESQSNPQSHQPASHIRQPSTSSTFGIDSHQQQHSNGDELELNTVEMIDIKEVVEEEERNDETGTNEYEGGQDDGQSRSLVSRMETTTPPYGQKAQVNIVWLTSVTKRKTLQEEEDLDDDNGAREGTSSSVKRTRASRSSNDLQEKQIITHSLRCDQVDCEKSIGQNELNDHMLKVHSIGAHRCLVKQCCASFHNKHLLGQHLAQAHQHTTQWNCGKCSKHFSSYHLLCQHNNQYHRLGHFQCSFPSCPFTGECKQKVFHHYTHQHKTPTLSKCAHPGCQYKTAKKYDLKRHQLVHLRLRPYRCKWPQCGFASAQRSNTITHIRSQHLSQNPGSVPNEAQLDDPKVFLDVVNELLE